MQRPGPLRDIPLDRVDRANNVSHPPFKQRPNKRPLSPNASPPCSPAKRQVVLDETGYPTTNSPAPIVWSSKSGVAPPACLEAVLPSMVMTPRKLDFGSAKSEKNTHAILASGAFHGRESGGTAALLLSPDAMEVDDYFSPQLAHVWRDGNSTPVAVLTRDSIHYPGFDVHVDSREALTSSNPPSTKLMIPGGASKRTKDADKENLPPRTKLGRAMKGSVEAVGLENVPVKVTCFANAYSQALPHSTTAAGLDFTLKSKLDMHNLADRGQGLPWLKAGQALIDDDAVDVSSMSLEDEMIGRG
ncbi:hypothetical protein PHLGIDRAFT_125368 [Phlebiopsis gigantea 11061_1 CR5-6]|uniref:Uncharacterized protein n=1 Tax=Phlebiopsis gigantea (strain 11061_1 CR5-6) TaxID=745531 RepID=A0A0C3SEN6_PHLG1|nr:hypothetical protein PHLGIDRAFT_125368 [Phlebiopsis gigantea 11061_1 CR5-6]